MIHRTNEGQMLISGLIGALGGRLLPVKRKQRGLATLGGAVVGAFLAKDIIVGTLEQVGFFGILDQLFAGLQGGAPAPSPAGGAGPGGASGGPFPI